MQRGEIKKSLGNIYSQDVPTGRPGTSLYDVLQSFWKYSIWNYRPLLGLNHQRWCITTTSGIYWWLICHVRDEKLPRTSLWDVLQHIWQTFKQIDVYISPIHIELYTIQAVMCHPGHISKNKNTRQVLKKSKGRPYETSCNIFCNSFKQNYVYKSPKHIELFTIQPSMCHTGHISRNKRNHWVLRMFPRTPLWDVLEQILWQFKINWRQHISQKH